MPTPPSTTGGEASAPTRSAIVAGEVSGYHLLDIKGYSRTKDLFPNGKYTNSLPFSVGGHSWHIFYYPNGQKPDAADFISIYVGLATNTNTTGAEPVKARVKFSLLDRAGKSVPSHTCTTDQHEYTTAVWFGYAEFMKRAYLETSEHLKDDCFTIRCDVTIVDKVCKKRKAELPSVLDVPPSDLHRHLGELLASKQGADVTFRVAGVTFKAHRYIFACRSPVFKAELFGSMREGDGTAVVEIEDMEAQVFEALLGFVYTDALPEMTPEEEPVMCQHLLVAADRYDMERLKLVCEDRLSLHISVGSAATILALAEQHRCRGLKEACYQFVQSPEVLNAVAATEGFEHLAKSCPSVLKELIFMATEC